MESLLKMMEQARDITNNAIQQNSQQCNHDANSMDVNWEYCKSSIQPDATKSKIFDMTNPEQYRDTAKNLNNFLNWLRSNIHSMWTNICRVIPK